MTDQALYDLLHRLFGIGTWDEDREAEQPWWKHRALEAHKIKMSRTKRRVDAEDLALAALYCKAHGEPVMAVTWLYRHIPAALRWDNARRRAAARRHLDELLASAIEHEQQFPDSPWLDRLVRARGPHQKEVLEEWQKARSLP